VAYTSLLGVYLACAHTSRSAWAWSFARGTKSGRFRHPVDEANFRTPRRQRDDRATFQRTGSTGVLRPIW